MAISLVGIILAYMTLKHQQFDRTSEIQNSIQQNFENYREFNDAGFMYRVNRVNAEKPGFPERLYKYIPKIRREGFVDVEFVIEPSRGNDSVVLPDPAEIQCRDLFLEDDVEIRQAAWSDSPVETATLFLRVHRLNDRVVTNAAHAVVVCVAEAKTGEIDEKYHAQFKHTDVTE